MTNFAEQFAERYGPNSGLDNSERYTRFVEEVLGTDLYSVQREIIETSAENQKVAVQSANGVGKSYTIANYALAFLLCNPSATVLVTSASYSTMEDTIFKPMADLLGDAQERFPQLPGKSLQAPPRIEFEGKNDHFLKCISTSNAKDLEGRHNERVLVIVEECDSESVDEAVIDSAESSITDDDDRMVAIGNPPASKANSFYRLMNNRTWETLTYSSFDSRNVRVEMGEHEGPKLPGIVELSTIEKDWLNYNDETWPGAEDARASDDRKDLNELWYRRRLGVVPPADSNAVRPFTTEDVESATERWSPKIEDVHAGVEDAPRRSAEERSDEWDAIGVDLATSDGSDSTVAVAVTDKRAEVLWDITNPTSDENERVLTESQRRAEEVITDAIREENFLDAIDADATRFKGSFSAEHDEEYRNRRSEAYFAVGDWLTDGGTVNPDSDLAMQLHAVSEVAEAEIKSLRSSETYLVTPKDEISSHIEDSSPDLVDALSMAVWAHRVGSKGRLVTDHELSQRTLFS